MKTIARVFLAIVLAALASPTASAIAGGDRIFRLSRRVGVDRHRHGKYVLAHKEYVGPMTMKHVGICTQEGPEERTGEIRLQISASLSRLNATLSVDGVECTYSGQLSDSYTGTMNCPDRSGSAQAVGEIASSVRYSNGNDPAVLLRRQQAKLARGAEDKVAHQVAGRVILLQCVN